MEAKNIHLSLQAGARNKAKSPIQTQELKEARNTSPHFLKSFERKLTRLGTEHALKQTSHRTNNTQYNSSHRHTNNWRNGDASPEAKVDTATTM